MPTRFSAGFSASATFLKVAEPAHELSTPLATIAVVAREVERQSQALAASSAVADSLCEDARLIRAEVNRCQVILDGMSGRAKATPATTSGSLPAATVAQLARERLPLEQQQRLQVEIDPASGLPAADGPELAQAVSSLLKNAFDASGPSDAVRLRFAPNGAMCRIEVHDRGTGMSDEARRRAGEPFYTTKEPGKGLGLGLFLTRAMAERYGGSLTFEGDSGTVAVLEVPAFLETTS